MEILKVAQRTRGQGEFGAINTARKPAILCVWVGRVAEDIQQIEDISLLSTPCPH